MWEGNTSMIDDDFTKDELIAIFNWAHDRLEAIGLENFNQEKGVALYAKINHMIENITNEEE